MDETMKTENVAVANEILRQLGGGRAMVMIGGTPIALGTTPALNVPFKARAKNKIKVFRIELMADDTYTVTFWTGRNATKVAEIADVYCDTLVNVIESTTGLYLSL